MFSPAVGDEIEFEGHRYTFPAAFPGAPFPIEIEGARATVIRTRRIGDGTDWALKVFKPKYRTDAQMAVIKRLDPLSRLPGLIAATRSVIPSGAAVATKHPDLEWAVLMPWVEGDTWGKILGLVQQRKRTYTQPEVEVLATQMLHVLADLEPRRIVHCDLSRGNILVKSEAGKAHNVQLVDLEDMLIDGYTPASTTPGTQGYSLPGVNSTACPEGDRYAGAILVGEALALALPFDDRLLSSEGVFRGNRTDQNAQARFDYVCGEIAKWQPRYAKLLFQAWHAQSLRDCAPLSDVLASFAAGQPGWNPGVGGPAPVPQPIPVPQSRPASQPGWTPQPGPMPGPGSTGQLPPNQTRPWEQTGGATAPQPARVQMSPDTSGYKAMIALAGVVAAVFGITSIILGVQFNNVKTNLGSANNQISSLQTQLDTANAATTKAQSDLTTANATITDLQSQLTGAQLPEVHCTVGFYPGDATTGETGTTANIRNVDDTAPITLSVKIDRPSDHTSKTIDNIYIAGHASKDIGSAEGWAFQSGDVITVSETGHKSPGTWTVP